MPAKSLVRLPTRAPMCPVRWLVGALACALVSTAAHAQVESASAGAVCRLPVDAPDAAVLPEGGHPGDGPPGALREVRSLFPTCDPSERTARFDVTYTGFPADARTAFQAAVDVWACRVASPRPIRIDASWEPLEARTLGTAGPLLYRNFAGAPRRDTWYPAALADVFAGRDLNADQPDIVARFNSTFAAWHLDPAAPPPPSQFDLATVVLHEVAHGLGLIGALTVRDGAGFVGGGDTAAGPYSFDRFTEDGRGTPLLTASVYPDGSAALSAALRSEAVFFDGPAVRQATQDRARLYAPPAWNDGASYSHLDEQTYAPGTPDGLMTPFLVRGERVSEPGATVCAVLADVGWTLAGGCADRTGVLPAPLAGLTAERTGPNPFAARTGLRLRAAAAGALRAHLFDASGRRVAVLLDRSVGAGETVDVEVSATGLAAGVYFVRIAAGDAERVVPLVVAR